MLSQKRRHQEASRPQASEHPQAWRRLAADRQMVGRRGAYGRPTFDEGAVEPVGGARQGLGQGVEVAPVVRWIGSDVDAAAIVRRAEQQAAIHGGGVSAPGHGRDRRAARRPTDLPPRCAQREIGPERG